MNFLKYFIDLPTFKKYKLTLGRRENVGYPTVTCAFRTPRSMGQLGEMGEMGGENRG